MQQKRAKADTPRTTLQAYHDWVADSVLDVRMQLEQCLLSPSASRSDVAQSRGG